MYTCYYLLVWCDDSACWWQADECEERSLGRAIALLRGRNPPQCRRGRPWAVVPGDELDEALARKPEGVPLEAREAIRALAA
jgi:hypothetical protein